MARIVIFEDEPALRALLADELEEAGHEVRASGTGRPAHDPGMVGDADLVVTDLMMPDCDGLEVIAAVRRLNPRARIVAMSGGGRTVTTDFLPMAQELGADRILRKPFLPETLLGEVAALLAPGG
jgi:DNA-binding response OmpR family regulator